MTEINELQSNPNIERSNEMIREAELRDRIEHRAIEIAELTVHLETMTRNMQAQSDRADAATALMGHRETLWQKSSSQKDKLVSRLTGERQAAQAWADEWQEQNRMDADRLAYMDRRIDEIAGERHAAEHRAEAAEQRVAGLRAALEYAVHTCKSCTICTVADVAKTLDAATAPPAAAEPDAREAIHGPSMCPVCHPGTEVYCSCSCHLTAAEPRSPARGAETDLMGPHDQRRAWFDRLLAADQEAAQGIIDYLDDLLLQRGQERDSSGRRIIGFCDALEHYGRHADGCSLINDYSCTCGYSDALAGALESSAATRAGRDLASETEMGLRDMRGENEKLTRVLAIVPGDQLEAMEYAAEMLQERDALAEQVRLLTEFIEDTAKQCVVCQANYEGFQRAEEARHAITGE